MIPVISVTPEPANGIFCAGVDYTFTADCPNARVAEWFVQSTPPGFNNTDVTFGSSNSLTTTVNFAFNGQWIINIRCGEPI